MVLWLRIASILAVVQGTAHAWLFIAASPKHGAAEVEVVRAMQSQRFDFLGSMRSYWDFYFGYGVMAAATVFVEAALFWLLASAALRVEAPLRPIVALFVVAKLAHATIAWRYFFITPVVPDVLIAACLCGALLASPR